MQIKYNVHVSVAFISVKISRFKDYGRALGQSELIQENTNENHS